MQLPFLIYLLLALLTGVMLSATGVTNTALARRVGVFPGTLVNYLTGLATSLICVAVAGAWRVPSAAGLPPWLAVFLLTGGFFGVMIISATSASMARVPAVYVTVLMFIGQVLMGVVLDGLGGKPVTWGKIAGCALIGAGLLVNIVLDRRGAEEPSKGEVE